MSQPPSTDERNDNNGSKPESVSAVAAKEETAPTPLAKPDGPTKPGRDQYGSRLREAEFACHGG